MRLDKKQIQAFFLTSKWIVKNQRQLVTSAMHLAQELLTNVQHGGCSRTFAKKGKALTMRSVVCWPSEVDSGQLRAIIEADPLTTT